MVNSREKGARGEREFAGLCRANGYDARRGQQYCGANGDADVIGLPGIHIEVKRYKKQLKGSIVGAMDQSRHDAKADERPIVAHRKDDCRWLITMDADDWFEIYREWEAGRSDG